MWQKYSQTKVQIESEYVISWHTELLRVWYTHRKFYMIIQNFSTEYVIMYQRYCRVQCDSLSFASSQIHGPPFSTSNFKLWIWSPSPRKARERNNLLCHYFGYYFPQTFVKSVIIIRSYQTYFIIFKSISYLPGQSFIIRNLL